MAKTAVVIYHDADYDGLGSAAVCQLHLRHAGISTELIGWDYYRPEPIVPDETDLVFVVDLNVPSLMNDPRLVWIDHHKTAIDSYPKSIRGLRIDGVAACRLCWQWFTKPPDGEDGYWSLSDFQNREVEEPLLLTLLGEYDVWDLHDERAEWMQYFLKAESVDVETIRVLLQVGDERIDEMAGTGASIKRYADAYFRDTLKGSFIAKFDDKIRFLCCCAVRMNSAGFNQTDVDSSEFDAYLRFHVTPTDVNISLYQAPHNTTIDLGKLAKKYQGGGHKGAAGFRLSMDEFRRLLLG